MSKLPATLDKLWPLLANLVDGSLSETQRAELESMLLQSEEALLAYIDFVALHSELDRIHDHGKPPELDVVTGKDAAVQRSTGRQLLSSLASGIADNSEPKHRPAADLSWETSVEPAFRPSAVTRFQAAIHWQRHKLRFSVFVLVIVLLLWAGALQWIGPSGLIGLQGRPDVVEKTEEVATISELNHVIWKQDVARPQGIRPRLKVGDWVAVESGLVFIRYDTGALVRLDGPVEYRIVGNNSGYLQLGRLLARVEKKTANDFIVNTPAAYVIDLGTEFGVDVYENGTEEIHIFKGSVSVKRRSGLSDPVVLTADEGLQIDIHNRSMAVRIVASRDKFMQHASQPNGALPEPWQQHSDLLKQDRSLVVYYTFEGRGANSATLVNYGTAGSKLNGRARNCLWVSGRWPNKRALSFSERKSDSHVDLGPFSSKLLAFDGPFSVALWFKVHSVRHEWQTLIAKGNHTWRLHFDKEKNLSFGTNWDAGSDLVAEGNVTDGRWHLAVIAVAVLEQGYQKQLYVDGNLVITENSTDPIGAHDSRVFIGENSQFAGRNFHGVIDEVAIFSRTLAPKEVQAMYSAGIPLETQFDN